MSEAAFQPFPKMGRLTRTCIITEKIDGTNAQVNIVVLPDNEVMPTDTPIIAVQGNLLMYAGSRTRYITPGKNTDNAGFAAWCAENADDLFKLGPGRHFGEWWGKAIQCGYGLNERRFSLFNTSRWADRHTESGVVGDSWPASELPDGRLWAPTCCRVVPVLFEGMFSDRVVDGMLAFLKARGSVAAPGWMKPEGIVVFHTATGTLFKKTLEGDESPKGLHKGAPTPTPAAIDSEWARSET